MLTLNSNIRGNITRQLSDSDLESELFQCPFCGEGVGNSDTVMTVQYRPEVHRMHCRRCFCTYVNRLPTDSYLAQYYSQYYAGDTKRTHIEASRLCRRIAASVRKPAGRPLRILDFGGGDGGIAAQLVRELAVDEAYVAVVDYNTVVNSDPPPGTVIRLFPSLGELDGADSFDVVIASAVLEHVKPIGTILRELFANMAPQGVFYARTPYSTPLHLLLKRFGVRFDTNFPAHIYDLGPRFWSKCLQVLELPPQYILAESRPSLVETEWREAPLVTLAATVLKLPWKLFGDRYPWVGGWEVTVRRDGA